LVNYKVLKRVEFMDSLPSTLATGKLKKSTLVEMLRKKKREGEGEILAADR
jgi:non-ribosomal peptide synthetase component E (peptide arylation enzyme)